MGRSANTTSLRLRDRIAFRLLGRIVQAKNWRDVLAAHAIVVPGFATLEGLGPIVILGPNGSGKTKLAQQIVANNHCTSIGAQRRTWIDDSLPVQEEQQLNSNAQNHINQWRNRSWQPTEEINFVLSSLIQEHTEQLTRRNNEAISGGTSLTPTTDTKLMRLQRLWGQVYPRRRLEVGGYFPKVRRLDGPPDSAPYSLREMSDGERTVLYMAARVITCVEPIIVIDEPELHLHSSLSAKFWTEMEAQRSDCRFIYITHDLNFALSRIGSTLLTVGPSQVVQLDRNAIPAHVVQEVIGAATLPFYASRVVFFEGEKNSGFAKDFFQAWFKGSGTFAIAAGNMQSVLAAVSGLRATAVVGASVVGVVDRDFYGDEALAALSDGTFVLPVHEVESLICIPAVIEALADHIGLDSRKAIADFHIRVRDEFRGKSLNSVIANRVRSRVADLLSGAFGANQVDPDIARTSKNHTDSISALNWPVRVQEMFDEEEEKVSRAIAACDETMLALLPGKHLLSLLTQQLGMNRNEGGVAGLAVRGLLGGKEPHDAMSHLESRLEKALMAHLPARSA